MLTGTIYDDGRLLDAGELGRLGEHCKAIGGERGIASKKRIKIIDAQLAKITPRAVRETIDLGEEW